jgi:hypothetical protein
MKMNKQGTTGKRKGITLTVPLILELSRRLASGKRQSVVVASYKTGSLSVYVIKNRRTNDDYGIKQKCERPFQMTDTATTEISTNG